MSRKPKFCIITSQRSGSTWLSRLLGSHPQIRMLKGDPLWVDPSEYDNDLPRYCNYKKTTKVPRPWSLFNYFELFENYENESHDLLGFKVMHNHIKRNPDFLIRLLTDNYKVIHLTRRNHLDLIISSEVGNQYKVYRVKKTDVKNRPVTLDASSILQTFDFLERVYKYSELFLKFAPVPCLEVHYETLAANRDETLSEIADFLEIENNSALFQTDLVKVNNGSYEDKISNYEEVAQVIKESKYAYLLSN